MKNNLTDSGTDVYVTEGQEDYLSGCDDNGTSPHDKENSKLFRGPRGWKGRDWLAGFEYTKKNANGLQKAERFSNRKERLQDRIDIADSNMDRQREIIKQSTDELAELEAEMSFA